MPLDILFVFTANPEDYTNRGSIVTPLKDRIESQILTHYPKTVDTALAITAQEAALHPAQRSRIAVHELIRRIIEQVSFEARQSELVDQKSGVSARLTISALENAVSSAERRAIINQESNTQVWIGDLSGIIPSVTGKIELVYEGEQEGPYQVSLNLLERAIRTVFARYFPSPDSFKKRRGKDAPTQENPFRSIIGWFDKGNHVDLSFSVSDDQRRLELWKVDGLHALVTAKHPKATEEEKLLLMEFVLHGLASYSLISKKTLDRRIEFRDLMGSMLDLKGNEDDEENEDDDQ
jgi:magnesium chelatase subunit I